MFRCILGIVCRSQCPCLVLFRTLILIDLRGQSWSHGAGSPVMVNLYFLFSASGYLRDTLCILFQERKCAERSGNLVLCLCFFKIGIYLHGLLVVALRLFCCGRQVSL